MDDGEELSAQDGAVYRAVLRVRRGTLADVARTMPGSPDELDKSVARLVDLGLLRVDAGDLLTPVSPMLAEATVLGVEDIELDARRAAVERRRDAIRRLVPDWNGAYRSGDNENAVDLVAEHGAIANVLMHYAGRCELELLSLAPGRRPASHGDSGIGAANRHSARRGVATSTIYQQSALRDRGTRVHLRELASFGARIRLAPVVPGRGLVVDREVALLLIPADAPGRSGLAIVREPNIIAWLVSTFEQLWADARPLADVVATMHDEAGELDETRRAILRLLADGEKDEAISRRLSISVRTCRRHIAEYMAQVGASSRFQAGVIAARSGHAEAPARP